MGHQRQRLIADEMLMIFSLVLSTSVIAISFNLDSWLGAAAPVTRISFDATVTSAPTKPYRPVLEPVDARNFASNLGISSPDLTSQSSRPIAKSDNADGGVPKAVSHNYAADTRFAFAELAGLRNAMPGRPNGEVHVVKPLYSDGTRIGNLEVTVSIEGDLIFTGSQLKALLAKPGFEVWNASMQGLDSGPVNFATLRKHGIPLRFSPKRDAFEISY